MPETISSNTHPPTNAPVLSIPMKTVSSHVEFRQKTSLRFICSLNFLGIQLCVSLERPTLCITGNGTKNSSFSTLHCPLVMSTTTASAQRRYSRLVSHPSLPPSTPSTLTALFLNSMFGTKGYFKNNCLKRQSVILRA